MLLGRGHPGAGLPEPYVEFLVCQEMKWTYRQLAAQPAHRVEEVITFLGLQNEVERLAADTPPDTPGIRRRTH